MRFATKWILGASLVIASFLLNGCQTVAATAPKAGAYDKFEIVSLDFASRAPSTSLTADVRPWKEATRTFTLQRGDSTFDFNGGRSYFRTFQLPNTAAGRRLEIRSYYSRDFPTTLMVPAVRFLDRRGEVVGEMPSPPYEIRNVLGEHIRVQLTIPSGASLVTIYTTPGRVAERMNFRTYSMAAVAPVPMFNAHQTGFGGFWEGVLKMSVEDTRN